MVCGIAAVVGGGARGVASAPVVVQFEDGDGVLLEWTVGTLSALLPLMVLVDPLLPREGARLERPISGVAGAVSGYTTAFAFTLCLAGAVG